MVDGWYCALFIAGMLLCELDILASSPNHSLPRIFAKLEPHKNTIFMTLFIIGLYLAGVPCYSLDVANVREAPGCG